MLKLKADKETGIWQISGTVAGQRIRRSAGTRSKQVAQRELARLEKEAWAERHNPQAGKIAYEDACLAYMKEGGEARFQTPLLEHFAGVDITTIKPGHIYDAARAIHPDSSPATQNRNVITPAQAVINFAAARGWCQPIKVTRLKSDPPPKKAATREWLDAFMGAADDELGTLALFMFTTGARVSDALRIERIDGRRVYMQTKTGRREAIMSRELMLRMNGPFRWAHRWSLYKLWRRTCGKAGIEYLPPHQAGRHAFATEMVVRKRVDPATTAALGGWQSTRMLERYTHPEALESVIDEVFEPQPKLAKIDKVKSGRK